MRLLSICAAGLAGAVCVGPAAPARSSGAPRHLVERLASASQCTAAQAAAFAWWVGTWDYAIPGYEPGVTTVTASNGGCLLQESFVDIHNKQARATISFDSTTRTWKRTVTDPFRTYNSTGTFAADGSIAFLETATERERYRPTDKSHVHFIGESSSDGGKTWKVQFEATYTKRQ